MRMNTRTATITKTSPFPQRGQSLLEVVACNEQFTERRSSESNKNAETTERVQDHLEKSRPFRKRGPTAV